MIVRVAVLLSAAVLVWADGFVQRSDGAKIAYYVREGKGPNLVLIPGSWGDKQVFEPFIKALPSHLRIVVVELRGHGRSQPAAENPTMESLADDVLAAVDAAIPRNTRFYVSGHSIGGMLTIEIAGRRPSQVAGAIPMEGWAHHQVQNEAFPLPAATPLTAGQERQNLANHARVKDHLTPAQRTAFGSVWRKWDGTGILRETPVPFLQIWGDRGRPRPSRAQLRLPDKPAMEIAWMPGATHSILIQCPEAAAQATTQFIEKTEVTHMFALSRPPGRLPVEAATIYRAQEGIAGFNMHPYITHYQGKFWAIWSSNRVRDLQAGQYVRYATSPDGLRWSAPQALTPSEEAANYRYFARGLWQKEGILYALSARDEAVRPLFGPGLELRGYRWTGSRWEGPLRLAPDTINNFAPEKLPDGQWMMSRRDHKMRTSMLLGGVERIDQWKTVDITPPADGAKLDEPIWWTLPDGVLTAGFRDGSNSRRLYRSFSYDNGSTWTPPLRTDFPDATAKFNVLRLRSGLYVMASNPNTSGKRIPLSLSVSRDGRIFSAQAILRDAPAMYRYAGKDIGYAGYHYPQLLEHGPYLYVIHAENMEDIVLLRIPLSAVEHLAR